MFFLKLKSYRMKLGATRNHHQKLIDTDVVSDLT